jgi:hypothetical protein
VRHCGDNLADFNSSERDLLLRLVDNRALLARVTRAAAMATPSLKSGACHFTFLSSTALTSRQGRNCCSRAWR